LLSEYPEAKRTLERLIVRSLWQLLHDPHPATVEADIHRLERLIDVGYQLNLGLSLNRAQELAWLPAQPNCAAVS